MLRSLSDSATHLGRLLIVLPKLPSSLPSPLLLFLPYFLCPVSIMCPHDWKTLGSLHGIFVLIHSRSMMPGVTSRSHPHSLLALLASCLTWLPSWASSTTVAAPYMSPNLLLFSSLLLTLLAHHIPPKFRRSWVLE